MNSLPDEVSDRCPSRDGNKYPLEMSSSLLFRSETWDVEDVRRHWELASHCENILFPNQYPFLALPSKLGRYFWHMHCAASRPEPELIRDIAKCANAILNNIVLYRQQVDQFFLCDTLLHLGWLDYAARKSFVETTSSFLRIQTGIEMASFENGCVNRSEGAQILISLGQGSGSSLQRLYMWQMFARDQNPVLKDTTFCKYRDKGAFQSSATCKLPYWQSLFSFHALQILAVNYSYLADENGHTLCMLVAVLSNNLKELQLLCLREDLPYADQLEANEFDGHYKIPNKTWVEVCQLCPKLSVSMVFISLPLYEDIISFLSRSIPMQQLYLSSGIYLQFQQVWHIDSTIKTLIQWYSQSLEVLSLNLWRNRDILDSILVTSLDKFPCLTTLEFTGILYEHNTLKKLCKKIKGGVYSISNIVIRIQETSSTKDMEFEHGVLYSNRKRIQCNIEEVNLLYRECFKELGIHLDLDSHAF